MPFVASEHKFHSHLHCSLSICILVLALQKLEPASYAVYYISVNAYLFHPDKPVPYQEDSSLATSPSLAVLSK